MFKLARGRPLTAALKAVKVGLPREDPPCILMLTLGPGQPSAELAAAEAEPLDTRIPLGQSTQISMTSA
jgi:hypothetical protein